MAAVLDGGYRIVGICYLFKNLKALEYRAKVLAICPRASNKQDITRLLQRIKVDVDKRLQVWRRVRKY